LNVVNTASSDNILNGAAGSTIIGAFMEQA